jgi:hypothetical protein
MIDDVAVAQKNLAALKEPAPHLHAGSVAETPKPSPEKGVPQ